MNDNIYEIQTDADRIKIGDNVVLFRRDTEIVGRDLKENLIFRDLGRARIPYCQAKVIAVTESCVQVRRTISKTSWRLFRKPHSQTIKKTVTKWVNREDVEVVKGIPQNVC